MLLPVLLLLLLRGRENSSNMSGESRACTGDSFDMPSPMITQHHPLHRQCHHQEDNGGVNIDNSFPPLPVLAGWALATIIALRGRIAPANETNYQHPLESMPFPFPFARLNAFQAVRYPLTGTLSIPPFRCIFF